MKTFDLPDLGEGLQEAEIVTWHVGEGDAVVTEQPLVSVETDKAVVEIPAPYGGRVARLHADAGETVKVGAPLIDLDDGLSADAGTVVGRLPEAAPAAAKPGKRAGGGATITPASAPDGLKITPAVRALARRLGVDLTSIKPSGPGGLITTGDVQAAASGEGAAPKADTVAPGEPLKGVRRAMAQKMAQSHAEVVPCSVTEEADVSAWKKGEDITIRQIRAIAAGCAAAPALNAWFHSQAMTLEQKATIDLGIAADTESGLYVPVIRDVANLDGAALRNELERLKDAVRSHTVTPDDIKDPTITLSNFGALGAGLTASVVILPPQVAIIGTGRIIARAVPTSPEPDAKIEIRRLMPLSLTFDHRVIAGGDASRFLAAMIKDLAAIS